MAASLISSSGTQILGWPAPEDASDPPQRCRSRAGPFRLRTTPATHRLRSLMIAEFKGPRPRPCTLTYWLGIGQSAKWISRTLGPMMAPPARRTHCVSGREQGEVVGCKKGPMGRAARPGPKWPGQLRVAQAGARSQCAVQPVGHSEQISPENEPPTTLVWRSTAQEPLAPKDMGFQRGLAGQRTPLRKRPRHLRSWTRGSKVRTNKLGTGASVRSLARNRSLVGGTGLETMRAPTSSRTAIRRAWSEPPLVW